MQCAREPDSMNEQVEVDCAGQIGRVHRGLHERVRGLDMHRPARDGVRVRDEYRVVVRVWFGNLAW
jgi:hypothetical protein